MANVILMHSVENMDTWLAKDNRARLFPEFCQSYRLFRVPGQSKVALALEGVDVPKMEALLGSPAATEAKKQDGVIDPLEMYVEVEGAR